MINALDKWVVNGTAPNELIASRINSSGNVDMTRPISPYPKKASLINPNGSSMDANNFKCSYF